MAEDTRDFCPVSGKITHHSPQAANRAAKNSSRMGKGVTPYRCDDCDGWHVGRGKPHKLSRVQKVHGPLTLASPTKGYKPKVYR